MPTMSLHKRILDSWPYTSEAHALSRAEIKAVINRFQLSKRQYLGLTFILKTVFEQRHPEATQNYDEFITTLQRSHLTTLPRSSHPTETSLRKTAVLNSGFSPQSFSEDTPGVSYLTQNSDCDTSEGFTPIASDTKRTLYRKNFERSKACGPLNRNTSAISDDSRKKYYPLFLAMRNQFEFQVTKTLIDQRVGSRRPWTQKQVMFGYTAKEVIHDFGFEAHKDGRGSHWAHQWGWGLGGQQMAMNLDPATAGSNYHTYALIESQIRHILSQKNAPESVKVSGRVQYWSGTPIPKNVYYSLSLEDGKQLDVKINCNEQGYPHKEDQKAVRKFIKTISPQSTLEGKSKPWQFATRKVFDTDGELCQKKGFFAQQRRTNLRSIQLSITPPKLK